MQNLRKPIDQTRNFGHNLPKKYQYLLIITTGVAFCMYKYRAKFSNLFCILRKKMFPQQNLKQDTLPITEYYKYKNNLIETVANQIDQVIRLDDSQDSGWKAVLEKMKESAISLLKEQPQISLIMNQQGSIELTRKQVFGFLSLMYFDLTISQEDHQKENKFNFYQDMYHLRNNKNKQLAIEKFKCIQAYFKLYCRFENELSCQKITISKFKLKKKMEIKEWMKSKAPLVDIEFINGSMFDYEDKTLVDFADPFIGGLVLDESNCAQEEIIMLLHPEAIVASLFFSRINEDEAIYFENVLRTCNFTGYERTFKCLEIIDYQPKMENILVKYILYIRLLMLINFHMKINLKKNGSQEN